MLSVFVFNVVVFFRKVLALVALHQSVEELLLELPLVLAWFLLLSVHQVILTLLFGVVDEEVTELSVNLLPHVVLGIGDN